MKDYDVFISHASEDTDWCEKLAKDLRKAGLKVWFDQWQMKVGENVIAAMNEGLAQSRWAVMVLTPKYIDNQTWAKVERDAITHQHHGSPHGFAITLLLEDCTPPPLLRVLQYLDFRDPTAYHSNLERLIAKLRSDQLNNKLQAIESLKPIPERVHKQIRKNQQESTLVRSQQVDKEASPVEYQVLLPATKGFINRQIEIRVAEDLLTRLATDTSVAVEGIVYYGPPGIGKSRLLQDIAERCSNLRFLPATIDFQRQKISSQRNYLFQLWTQFEKSRSRKKLRDTFINSTDEEALSLFVQRLREYLKGLPFILLLDSCEYCDLRLFDWIGQVFLSHLETTLACPIGLFLATRGQQVTASNWPVQYIKSIKSHYVTAFDLASTTAHLAVIDKKKNTRGGEKLLYQLSIGHPLSTEALVRFLQRATLKADAIPQNRQRLVQLLYDEVIDKYLLPPADSWPHENFEILCILRRFDAALLEKIEGEYAQHWYTAHIQELQKVNVHLLHIDRGEPVYQLDNTVRKLLYGVLSILRPQRVLEIHTRSLRFHEHELQQEALNGRPRAALLLEMLYHQIRVELFPERTNITAVEEWLQTQLQTYFKPEERDDILQLELLRNLLDADTDFIELLGRSTLDRLLQKIIAFVGSSPLRETFHLAIRHNSLV